MSVEQRPGQESPGGDLQAALARTAARGLSLYFSRPVRLFRPSKVSGWHFLHGLARGDGVTLGPQYLSSLIKNNGIFILPKHFIPPMLVNACLGTVLWTVYSETSVLLHPHLGHHPTLTAAAAGCVAGGAQALAAAPVENVRLLLEGDTLYQSWSHAWKEVFKGAPSHPTSKEQAMNDVREVRTWMRDVRDLAGRGWEGWGWGCAKDMTGFAAFFAVFEVTRRVANYNKAISQDLIHRHTSSGDWHSVNLSKQIPRVVNGLTLVTGGVIAGLSYEIISRPWDAARRAVQLDKVTQHNESFLNVILAKYREEGLVFFFRDPSAHTSHAPSGKLHTFLRTLGRVGPWGIGFLVWEAYGPGLSINN